MSLPCLMFFELMTTNLWRSCLECVWKSPRACPSSWASDCIVWHRKPIERSCWPSFLPTRDQHNSFITTRILSTDRAHVSSYKSVHVLSLQFCAALLNALFTFSLALLSKKNATLLFFQTVFGYRKSRNAWRLKRLIPSLLTSVMFSSYGFLSSSNRLFRFDCTSKPLCAKMPPHIEKNARIKTAIPFTPSTNWNNLFAANSSSEWPTSVSHADSNSVRPHVSSYISMHVFCLHASAAFLVKTMSPW